MGEALDADTVLAIFNAVEDQKPLRTIAAELGVRLNTAQHYRDQYLREMRGGAVADNACSDCGKAKFYAHGPGLCQECYRDRAACRAELKLGALPVPMESKACGTCGAVKPAAEFSRSVSGASGLTASCKACIKRRRDKVWGRHRASFGISHDRVNFKGRGAGYFDEHPALGPDEARKLAAETLAKQRYGSLHLDRGRNWSLVDVRALAALCATGADISKAADSLGRPPKTLAWKARDSGLAPPVTWMALITPERKPALVRVQMAYPFIAKPRDEHADMLAINALVPKDYPPWIRADVCQNILLAVLEGEVTVEQLRHNPQLCRQFVGRFLKEHRDNMLVSIEGIHDDERSYMDIAARPESINDARLAIHSIRTHHEATQEQTVHDHEMADRARAWHAVGIHLTPDDIRDDLFGAAQGDWGKKKRSRIENMTTRRDLHIRQNGKCGYCKCDMRLQFGYPDSVSRDHIIPISEGGPDTDANLIGACSLCNERKGSMPVADFLKLLGRPVPARDVQPGATWAFREHRSQAHVGF